MKEWIIAALLSFLKSFVVKQLKQYQDQIDWAKIKSDVGVKVSDFLLNLGDIIPGEFLDDAAEQAIQPLVAPLQQVVYAVIDELQKSLSGTKLIDNILELVEKALKDALKSEAYAAALDKV